MAKQSESPQLSGFLCADRLVGACVVPLIAVCAGRAIPVTLELASSAELASHRSSSRGPREVLLLQVELFIDDLNLGVDSGSGASISHWGGWLDMVSRGGCALVLIGTRDCC